MNELNGKCFLCDEVKPLKFCRDDRMICASCQSKTELHEFNEKHIEQIIRNSKNAKIPPPPKK